MTRSYEKKKNTQKKKNNNNNKKKKKKQEKKQVFRVFQSQLVNHLHCDQTTQIGRVIRAYADRYTFIKRLVLL